MPLQVTVDAGQPPVTVADAKLHLRVDHAADDALIGRLVDAAERHVQDWTRLQLRARTIVEHLDDFPGAGSDGLRVFRPSGTPVQEIKSVKYFDTAGVLQTLDASAWQADVLSVPARVLPAPGADWPSVQAGRLLAVQVEYTCGHTPQTCPPTAKQAILLLVGHWYENREAVVAGTIATEVQLAAAHLLGSLWHGRLTGG